MSEGTVWTPITFSIGAEGTVRRSAQLKEVDYAEIEEKYAALTDAQIEKLIFHVPEQNPNTLVGVYAKPEGS